MSPRFHVLVSDVDQQWNEGTGWVQDYLAWPQGRRLSLDLTQAAKSSAVREYLEFVISG